MTDYKNARYFAISGIGYGKGFTAEEAVENYVKTQLRNYDAKMTVYKTKPKWREALTTGEAKATVWLAPEGTTGFVMDHTGLNWTDDDNKYTHALESERIEL